jgi:hypothetical protein
MARPHPTAKEEASTPLPGHIFTRHGVIPATGEVTLRVANDKRDGFGRPGRTGIIKYDGRKGGMLRVQISSDGHKYSNEITIPVWFNGFPNYYEIKYDDRIYIHTIRLLGLPDEGYDVIIMPGRGVE